MRPGRSASRAVKLRLREFLHSAGYALFNIRRHYGRDGLYTLHQPRFTADPDFKVAYERGVAASSGVDPCFEWRIHVALWTARSALRAPGDFVECGVNAGFVSSAIMHRLNWSSLDREFHLIDTFRGPVAAQFSAEEISSGRWGVAEEAVARGAYVTDLDRVRRNYAEWPNARVVQGVVPDVLPGLPVSRVAFLHLDLNCAYPEKAALEYFWPLLSPGACVLLDDYAYAGCDAQGGAIDSLAAHLGFEVLVLPTGQGLILR